MWSYFLVKCGVCWCLLGLLAFLVKSCRFSPFGGCGKTVEAYSIRYIVVHLEREMMELLEI